MVDGVNFNPFTQKSFTAEEIAKLDTDQDGKVSVDEFQAGLSWLAQTAGTDEEGEVDFPETGETGGTEEPGGTGSTGGTGQTGGTEGTDAPEEPSIPEEPIVMTPGQEQIYNNAVTNNMNEKPETAVQLQDSVQIVVDEFIESYCIDNNNLTPEVKDALGVNVKKDIDTYLQAYIKAHPQGPYDMKDIAGGLMNELDSSSAKFEKINADVADRMNNLTNDPDGAFNSLADYADKAEGDYLKNSEFIEIRNQSVNYIMGKMLNGETDADFLSGINKNYAKNSNYKAAENAIAQAKTETDPVKQQELLDKAQSYLNAFIGTTETSKKTLVGAIDNKIGLGEKAAQAERTAGYKEQLIGINDKLAESYSNEKIRVDGQTTTHSQDDVDQYTTKLNNLLNAFLETYKGDGKNIEADYKAYVNKVQKETDSAVKDVDKTASKDSFELMQDLKEMAEKAGTYISDSETKKLCEASTEYVINQLANGKEDINMLNSVLPGYQSNAKYVEAKALLDGLKSSITPTEDLAKAKQLLNEMFEEAGAKNIQSGLKNMKMAEFNLDEVAVEQLTSSIEGYDNNESVCTDRYKSRDGAMDAIQEKAKQQLESLRAKMHDMLKAQLGGDYDEASVDKMIDEAIYSTINEFTDSRVDKSGKHYSMDEAGFSTSKSGKKSRGVYNIQQLVNTFLDKFETLSSGGTLNDDGPVGTESTVKNTTLADDYQDNKTETTGDIESAKALAKSKMNVLAEQIKSQLKAELGDKYNASEINKMIDKAIFDTVNEITLETTVSKHRKLFGHKTVTKGFVSTVEVTDAFMKNFNAQYEGYSK